MGIICLFFWGGSADAATKRFKGYTFRMEVISDQWGKKPEGARYGKPFVSANPGERYSIVLYNPLPVRVAVNLTVDGLNSISGNPSSPSEGRKWIIEPNSHVKISGWQVSSRHNRRFFFTNKEKSYAAWRSNAWARDLSVNCGVIGAAFFWSREDLAPPPRITQAPQSSAKEKPQAGTGMGEKKPHPVVTVQFDYDTGMYNPKNALVIYYDFGPPRPPQPFLDKGFAPEQK